MATARVPSGVARGALVLVGLGFLGAAGWLFQRGAGLADPALAAAAGAALLLGAVFLPREPDGIEAGPVLAWSVAGLVLLGAVTWAALLIRDGSGFVARVSPVVVLSAIGAVAGMVAGVQVARRQQVEARAERAEETADLLSEERTRFEVLNRATRSLLRAETPEAVAETVVSEGHVGVPGSFVGVWLHDSDRTRLVPAGVSTTTGGQSVEQLWPDDPAFETFRDGAPAEITSSPGIPDIDTLYAVPLGEYGLLVAGSDADLGPRERDLVEVYGRTALAALDRLEREHELQRQNERLDAFASVLAHDLRNPLSVIDGRVDLARMSGDLSELDHIEEAVDRMNVIIDDVLTLARGEGQLSREEVDLGELAQEAWEHVETPEAELEAFWAGTVVADRDRLSRLLENLFRNAIEHAGPDVTVTVGTLEEDTGFFVADDGPGIPLEDREQVLTEGYSGGGGTGIGLAIVRRIAEGHGWSVTVTSSGDDGDGDDQATADGAGAGAGARFEFRIGPDAT